MGNHSTVLSAGSRLLLFALEFIYKAVFLKRFNLTWALTCQYGLFGGFILSTKRKRKSTSRSTPVLYIESVLYHDVINSWSFMSISIKKNIRADIISGNFTVNADMSPSPMLTLSFTALGTETAPCGYWRRLSFDWLLLCP